MFQAPCLCLPADFGTYFAPSEMVQSPSNSGCIHLNHTLMNEPMEPRLDPDPLAAFGNDAFRARIFHEKYALRDADGAVREYLPAQMWQRVARGAGARRAHAHQR